MILLTYQNLNGFDMVYAVSQQTINAQLQLLWAMDMLPTTWKAEAAEGLYSIDAELGCPVVDFNTGDSSSRTAKLTMPLTKASFHYAKIVIEDGKPTVVQTTKEINGSSLSFFVNMSLAELASTYQNQDSIPDEVKRQLEQFDTSMFSIQHLFLNFEDANLLKSFDFQTNGAIPTDQPELTGQIRNLVEAFIDTIKGNDNPYIFGYYAVDKISEPSQATWQPTGCTYSIYSDAHFASRSSINYLLVTDHKTVPGSGAGMFQHNWVMSDQVEGSFVLSQALVMDPLLQSLANMLSIDKTQFSPTNNNQFFVSFESRLDKNTKGKTTCTLVPLVGTKQMAVYFNIDYNTVMHDLAGSYIGYVDGTIKWTTTLTFEVDTIKSSVNVSAKNSEVITTKKDHPNALGKFEHALAVFADFIITVFTFGQVDDVFQDLIRKDWQKTINTGYSTQMNSMKARAILPGGSEIMFKDAQFYENGSMIVATTVKN